MIVQSNFTSKNSYKLSLLEQHLVLDHKLKSSMNFVMTLYFFKYSCPLSVNIMNFLFFLSCPSFMKPLSINSFKYVEKLWVDKFEYLSRGVGFMALLWRLIIFNMSYIIFSLFLLLSIQFNIQYLKDFVYYEQK